MKVIVLQTIQIMTKDKKTSRETAITIIHQRRVIPVRETGVMNILTKGTYLMESTPMELMEIMKMSHARRRIHVQKPLTNDAGRLSIFLLVRMGKKPACRT